MLDICNGKETLERIERTMELCDAESKYYKKGFYRVIIITSLSNYMNLF